MARRGTVKALSVEHEEWIADLVGGERNEGSGAVYHEYGDVVNDNFAIECKMTGNPSEVSKKSKLVKDFEKIAHEALSIGRRPMVALRYFDPGSPVSGRSGWVDLVVLTAEDAVHGLVSFDGDQTR